MATGTQSKNSLPFLASKEQQKYFVSGHEAIAHVPTFTRKPRPILIGILIAMHKEILTPEQVALLPAVAVFSGTFGLVGGTAIALHIGHRESIDFDLFSMEPFDNAKIRRKMRTHVSALQLTFEETGQLTFVTNGVKFTFFHYSYPIPFIHDLDGVIKIPDLLTLAAMKVFAIGNRAKWKDYVDLYFILRDHHSLDEIILRAREIFNGEFNERLLRTQLGWFEDMDYTEEVVYKKGFAVPDDEVKNVLIECSLH